MRLLFVSVITVMLMLPQSAAACCLFPFFPAYTAGYGGWGVPGYSPTYYSGGAGNCCNSCNYTPYSANYVGFAGYSNAAGCCASTCGSSCGGCSNCAPQPFTSGKPTPDPISDRDDDLGRDRTFGSPRDDRNLDDRNYDDREPADSFDRSDPTGRSGLGTGSSSDWDRSRNRSSDDRDSRFNGTDSSPDRSDFDRRDPASGLERFDGLQPFGSNRPDFDSSTPTPQPDAIDRTTNKPPMNLPVEEESPAATEEGAPKPPAGDAKSQGGTKTDAKDFLEPEAGTTGAWAQQLQLSQRESRSSHFDVAPSGRLAASTRNRHANALQISASREKDRTLQWISVPAPAGRNRL